ncbi:hypothetical protein [Janthinobacterium sp. HLX7-2]|uniref:hypothetical protein n=1 Tax=Janthinobacterium sp. HLX7-2 TaxID=1259331 RepID=UPI003F26767D
MTLDNIKRAPAAAPARVHRVSLVLSNRVRRNAVGPTFSLANGRGQRIALASVAPQGLGTAHAAAARMAYASELTGAVRTASMDYERTGAVSPETVSLMRRLLDDIGAA